MKFIKMPAKVLLLQASLIELGLPRSIRISKECLYYLKYLFSQSSFELFFFVSFVELQVGVPPKYYASEIGIQCDVESSSKCDKAVHCERNELEMRLSFRKLSHLL